MSVRDDKSKKRRDEAVSFKTRYKSKRITFSQLSAYSKTTLSVSDEASDEATTGHEEVVSVKKKYRK